MAAQSLTSNFEDHDMHNLLHISSSLFGAEGQSSLLAQRFITQWSSRHPGGRIITRDLSAQPVPHLTAASFQGFAASAAQRTAGQRAAVAYSDLLIDELKSADTIVLSVPMYNFSVPSTLRAYFDHIARAGVTFRYTSSGPEGLLRGKDAYVFITRGGVYAEQTDTQTPYLRQFLGFVGIDAQFIHAEGLAMGETLRDQSLTAANHTIAKLPGFAAAA
jgi:FMN-dependent NADH-azoreductase